MMSSDRVQLPTPINESEAVIDGFWDQHISALRRYTVNKEIAGALPAHCNARAFQFWCWATLKWDRAPVGHPILTIERTMNVDVRRYDTLIIYLALPEHVSLTVDAAIDGKTVRLMDNEPGPGAQREFEAAIAGQRLQWLRLTLVSQRDQADEGWLYWIGLANSARRAYMLDAPRLYDDVWEPWLLSPDAKPEFAPRFGIYFDAADLPAMRRRARSPLYASLMQQIRARAHEALSFHKTPEDQIGEYLPAGRIFEIQARVRDWDNYPFHLQAPVIALLGLIDEDPQLLRFAARIAIAACHCKSWGPHFMQDFPGSTIDSRANAEAFAAAGIALALDWAGGWFTGAGEHLVRYNITHKALGRVRGTFLQYDYMWDCNQTHMIGLGRLLSLLVQVGNARTPETGGKPSAALAGLSPEVKHGWARAGADIDQFERDVYEMIDRYIQPDGSTMEGVGYWGVSMRTTLPALAALARYRGKPLSAMVNPRLEKMWTYISAMLATSGEPGNFLPVSDASSNVLPWDVIGMAAAMLPQPGWKRLLGACLGGGKTRMIVNEWTWDGTFTLIFGPDERTAPSVDVPVFHRFEVAGMITSNRPWPASDRPASTVRLHLMGAKENAGHCQPDKGSFILEAFGDVFAGDRGLTPYKDPRCRTLGSEVAHNLAVPEGCFQTNPSPIAARWQGDGDATRLHAEIDTSGVWQPPVRTARRRIESPRPDIIEIIDEFELDEARPVVFYLNTPLPINVDGTTAIVQGKRARLTVEAPWAAGAAAEEFYCDFAYTPYNRLRLTARAATTHRLVTRMHLTEEE